MPVGSRAATRTVKQGLRQAQGLPSMFGPGGPAPQAAAARQSPSRRGLNEIMERHRGRVAVKNSGGVADMSGLAGAVGNTPPPMMTTRPSTVPNISSLSDADQTVLSLRARKAGFNIQQAPVYIEGSTRASTGAAGMVDQSALNLRGDRSKRYISDNMPSGGVPTGAPTRNWSPSAGKSAAGGVAGRLPSNQTPAQNWAGALGLAGRRFAIGAAVGGGTAAAWGAGPGDFSIGGVATGAALGGALGMAGGYGASRLGKSGLASNMGTREAFGRIGGKKTIGMQLGGSIGPSGITYSRKNLAAGGKFSKGGGMGQIGWGRAGMYGAGAIGGLGGLAVGNNLFGNSRRRKSQNTLNHYGEMF